MSHLAVSIHSNIRKWNSDNTVINNVSMGETKDGSTHTFVAPQVSLQ